MYKRLKNNLENLCDSYNIMYYLILHRKYKGIPLF